MHSYLRVGFAFVCCGGLLAVQMRATSRNGAAAGRREPLATGCHDQESCVLTRQRVNAEAAAIARRRAMLEQIPPPAQSEAERQQQLGRRQPAETKASVVLEAEVSEEAVGEAPPKELHLDVVADVQPAEQDVAVQETEETDAAWCRRAAQTFGVVPHQTWGSLSTAQQATWTSRGCDAVIAASAPKNPLSVRTPPLTPRHRSSISVSSGSDDFSGAGAAKPSPADAAAQCTEMRERHHVLPGTSWGTLSSRQQRLWDKLDCNTIDPELMRQRKAEADELDNYTQRQKEALAGRTPERKLRRAAPSMTAAAAAAPDAAPDATAPDAVPAGGAGARPPVVAVCVCTTSRNTDFTTLSQFALFSIMFPSLRSSIEPAGSAASSVASSLGSLFGGGGGGGGGGGAAAAAAPFEYWVYMTFDEGDAFFDNAAREAEVRAWLETNMVAPLRAQGVTLQVALLRYKNTMRKPGPAFNFMTAAAYEDGADYIYRVNDDTKFVGPWAASAVATLAAFEPPNVGVVGPLCAEGNTLIMTHDLVHRTHLMIFEHYYPPVFSDWWMVRCLRRLRPPPARARRRVCVCVCARARACTLARRPPRPSLPGRTTGSRTSMAGNAPSRGHSASGI